MGEGHTLRSLKFYNERKGEFVIPSLQKCSKTIKNFQYLWEKLQGFGFEYLVPRYIKQDPLEIFFGDIRSLVSSFKTLVINNFFSSQSPSSNCEEDDVTPTALENLEHFILNRETDAVPCCSDPESRCYVINGPPLDTNLADLSFGQYSYISGFIVKKLLRSIGQCNVCKADLIADEKLREHFVIESRDYSGRLNYPATHTTQYFKRIYFCPPRRLQ